jgi:predicted RND superfamily exporter protein
MLGTVGVVVICISTIFSYAFTSLCGIDFSPLSTAVVPLISLSLGIVDTNVVVHTYANEVKRHKTVLTVMAATLADAGPSITFTSFSNVIGFLVASTTPIPVVSWFCKQMAITISVGWLCMILFFVPAIMVDCYRTLVKKNPNLV